MSKGMRFADEFKQDAVAQVLERGYAVSEGAERLGISTKSLYTWKAQFSTPAGVRDAELDLAAEFKRIKRELSRVTEERNILKRARPLREKDHRIPTDNEVRRRQEGRSWVSDLKPE